MSHETKHEREVPIALLGVPMVGPAISSPTARIDGLQLNLASTVTRTQDEL